MERSERSVSRSPTGAAFEISAWRTAPWREERPGARGVQAGPLQEQLVRGLRPSEEAPGGQEQEEHKQVAYRNSS